MSILRSLAFLLTILCVVNAAAQTGRDTFDAIPGKVYGIGLHYKHLDICSNTPATLISKALLATTAELDSTF